MSIIRLSINRMSNYTDGEKKGSLVTCNRILPYHVGICNSRLDTMSVILVCIDNAYNQIQNYSTLLSDVDYWLLTL